MELVAQSVSWFYPSFPGRHLYVEKCLRIVSDWVSCASQNLFLCQLSFLCMFDAWIRQRGKKYESINLQWPIE